MSAPGLSARAFSEYSMATAANSNVAYPEEEEEVIDEDATETTPCVLATEAVRQSRSAPQDSALSNPEQVPEAPEHLTCYERIYNRYVLIFFLFMTNFFLFFDRGSLTSLITDIRSDKQIAGGNNKSLSETEGGYVISAYMLGFLLSSPICSGLGNIMNARWIMLVGLIVVQSTSFLTGFADSYVHLLLIRVFSGVGEAATGAYFMTMIDNSATPKTRTLWLGVYMLAIPLGMAIGTTLSGYISANVHTGDRAPWRLAFYISGLGGIPFALGAILYPARFSPTIHGLKKKISGLAGSDAPPLPINENEDDKVPLMPQSSDLQHAAGNTVVDDKHKHAHPWDAVKRLAKNQLFMCLVVGMGTFILIIGGAATVQQPMLRFGPWKMTQTEAASLMGISAVPSVIGSVIGGMVLDKFGGSAGRRGLFRCCRHLFMMSAICTPLIVASYFVYNTWAYAAMSVVTMMAFLTVMAPSSAAILTSVDKDIRTYAMSYSVMFERAVALPGPTIIGFLADKFSEGCHSFNYQYMCEGTLPPTEANTTIPTTTIAFGANETSTSTASVTQSTSSAPSTGLFSTTTIEPTTPYVPNYSRSDNCVWIPGKEGSNGSCMSEFEDRNATAFFSVGYVIPIVAWGIAAVIAYRKGKKAMALHALSVLEAEYAATNL